MIVNVSVNQPKSLRENIIVKFFTIPICNGHIQLFVVSQGQLAHTHACILLSLSRARSFCDTVNRLSLSLSLSLSRSLYHTLSLSFSLSLSHTHTHTHIHNPSHPLSLIPISPRLPLMFSSGDFYPSSGGYVSSLRHAISPATVPCLS